MPNFKSKQCAMKELWFISIQQNRWRHLTKWKYNLSVLNENIWLKILSSLWWPFVWEDENLWHT